MGRANHVVELRQRMIGRRRLVDEHIQASRGIQGSWLSFQIGRSFSRQSMIGVTRCRGIGPVSNAA
jgi:hypothetical protein